MKSSASSTRTIIAIFVVIGLAVVFWVLFLGPKRDEASELGTKVETQQATLAQAQSAVVAGEEARDQFSKNYKQLVVLGKAVPAGDETASLLVELEHVADKAKVSFNSIKLSSSGSSSSGEEAAAAEPVAPTTEGTTGTPASSVAPTEAAASLQPLGATVGPAGLSVMPYELIFSGSFFGIADFLKGMDSLVDTGGPEVGVDGRLVTLDGFSLAPEESEGGSSTLNANFSVTTYLIPPGQGLTTEATSTAPAEATESPESPEVSEAR